MGRSNKNDPNDALSVAVAALRTPRLACVEPADHAGVLRLLAKRNGDRGRACNRTACRLHSPMGALVAGGMAKEINASKAQRLLASVNPPTRWSRAAARSPWNISMICAASMSR